jgi:hypothetical protein
VILYLSYFYKSRELPIRLSFFWTSYITTQIVAAFLAYGILHLRGHSGLAGWRWYGVLWAEMFRVDGQIRLFAIEGAVTAVIGIISW